MIKKILKIWIRWREKRLVKHFHQLNDPTSHGAPAVIVKDMPGFYHVFAPPKNSGGAWELEQGIEVTTDQILEMATGR